METFDPSRYPDDRVRELVGKLRNIFYEQEDDTSLLAYTTVGGVTASRDKHAAMLLILDFFTDSDVAFYYDQIR